VFDEEYNNKHDLNDYENSKLSNTFIKNNNEENCTLCKINLDKHTMRNIYRICKCRSKKCAIT